MTRARPDALDVVARLREAHDAAHVLGGANYERIAARYRDLIRRAMGQERLTVLSATLRLAERVPAHDGVTLMWLLAAAVDLIEGCSGPDTKEPHAPV